MSVELNTVVQEVVIDDSQSAQGAARVVDSMEQMAAASDKATAATQRQASGFDALDAALKTSTPAQESALRRLNSWKAQADPVEGALQRLSRAEQDLNRAVTQGISTEREKARVLDQLWTKLVGAAEAQEKLNAAMRAQEAQSSFNSQLGVREEFGTAQRAADVAAYGQEIDRLQQKYAPLVAAQALYERQIEEITQAQRTGALTAAQAADALAMNEGGYKRNISAINASQQAVMGHTGAVKLQTWQLTNLGQQMQDVFVQMQMGTNPFTILAQQGPQITTAMGGVRNALALVMDWINPVYVGLGLLAAGVAAVSVRSVSLQSDARGMSVSLRAWGKDAEITTQQTRAYIDALRDYGVSQADAITAAEAAIAAAGATAADLSRQAAANAADFSAAYGGSIDEATKKLIELRTKGFPAIKALDESYRFLTDAQAKHILGLVEAGQQAEATEIALAALHARIKGLADEAMSPLGRALNETKRSWSGLLDTAAGSDIMIGFVTSLGSGFKAVADVLRGDMTSAWDAWVSHVTNDPAMKFIEKALEYQPGIDRLAANTPGTRQYAAAQSSRARLDAWTGVGPTSSGAIGGTNTDPKLRNEIDDQVSAYEREISVLRQSSVEREAYRAKIETEISWRRRGADETQAQMLGEKAYQAVLARSVVAVNDNIAALDTQAQQLIKVGAAYEISASAGRDADLHMQAFLATTAKGVAGEDAYYAALKRVSDQQRAMAEFQKLANERQQSAVALEEARIAGILDPSVRHAEELKLERQVKLNELTREYGSLTEQAMKHLSEFDKKQAADEIKRYWDDVRQMAMDVSSDISQFLVDGFVNAGEGGKSMFSSLWDGAMAGAKRFLANLAAEFLKQKLILPIAMSVIGENSSLMGIIQPGGAGGMSGMGNMAGSGSMFSGLGGMAGDAWGWASGLFGGGAAAASAAPEIAMGAYGLGSGISVGTAGSATLGAGGLGASGGIGGAASAAYAIPVWGWIAAAAATVKSFVEGSDPASAKGAINTLLLPSIEEWQANPIRSAGNALDPIGTVLSDFGLPDFLTLGGLFGSIGNDQPSNKFAARAIDISAGTIGEARFNPDERSSQTIKGSEQMAQVFLDIAKTIEEITGGTGAAGAYLIAGERDGFQVGVGEAGLSYKNGEGVRGSFKDPEKAIEWMVSEFAKTLSGEIDENYRLVIAKGGGFEALAENLSFVQAALALTADAVNPLTSALAAVNDNFDDATKRAHELGLTTELLTKLEAARAIQLAEVQAGFSLQGYGNVANAMSQITGFVSQYQTGGGSSLNPLAREALAQQNYDALFEMVQGGDLSRAAALTGAAGTLLDISRQNYGSTAAGTSIEASVLKGLSDLGLSISTQQSMTDQVTRAIQLAAQSNVDKSEELRAEIVRMREDLKILAQQIAA